MLKMIELPYTLDALEPYYSKETLALHYNELYKGYVENTNKTNERIKNMRTTNNFEDIKCLEKNLTLWGCEPLLILDMWEHSYYLQYKTRKQEYIMQFWNIVNWNVVNKRWEQIEK